MNTLKFSDLFVFHINSEFKETIYRDNSYRVMYENYHISFDFSVTVCVTNTLARLNALLFPSSLLQYIKNSKNIVNYHIVALDTIEDLNFFYYKKQKEPTDILTFPYQDDYTNLLGEIFMNPETTIRKALKKQENVLNYCKRLVIHGLLHLLLGQHSSFFDLMEDNILGKLDN